MTDDKTSEEKTGGELTSLSQILRGPGVTYTSAAVPASSSLFSKADPAWSRAASAQRW